MRADGTASPIERMLDLAIASTAIAMAPITLAGWATLAWLRAFGGAPGLARFRLDKRADPA